MANIFMESFNVPSQNILRTGIPRTDFFFDKGKQEKIKLNFIEKYHKFKEKKIILYAPTFRDNQIKKYDINLDIDQLYKALKDDYILIIKLHPMVKSHINYEDFYPGFVFDFTYYSRVNELLCISDFLITDYSSISFEFAFLKRPMIFYLYDFEFYKRTRGVLLDFESVAPGPIASNTDQIINYIFNYNFDINLVCEFSEKWNEYLMEIHQKYPFSIYKVKLSKE